MPQEKDTCHRAQLWPVTGSITQVSVICIAMPIQSGSHWLKTTNAGFVNISISVVGICWLVCWGTVWCEVLHAYCALTGCKTDSFGMWLFLNRMSQSHDVVTGCGWWWLLWQCYYYFHQLWFSFYSQIKERKKCIIYDEFHRLHDESHSGVLLENLFRLSLDMPMKSRIHMCKFGNWKPFLTLLFVKFSINGWKTLIESFT